MKASVPTVDTDTSFWWPALTGIIVFIFYSAYVPTEPYWLDAPEFVATGFNLGQSHPPGHPAIQPILKGFLLLPVGSIAFRANLFSAFFAAVSAVFMFLLTTRIVSRTVDVPSGGLVATLGGFAGALAFAGTTAMWIQAMSVEVYTFQTATILFALYLALAHSGDPRYGVLIGLVTAIGLANHHLLTVLTFPAVAVAFFSNNFSRRAIGIPVLIAPAIVLLGTYASLMARALAGAWPSWENAARGDGLTWIASARIFSQSIGGHDLVDSSVGENILKAMWLITDSVTLVGLILSFFGIYLIFRLRQTRYGLAIVLLIAGSAGSKILMGILDPNNPDDHGYFLSGIAGVVIMQTLSTAVLLAYFNRKGVLARLVGIVVVFVVALLPGFDGLAIGRVRAAFNDLADVHQLSLAKAPNRSVVFISHYPVYFSALYQQIVLGDRPDVTVVQESLYHKARGGIHYASQVFMRDPDLKDLATHFISSGQISWAKLLELAVRRPTLVEASSDFGALLGDVAFDGWFFRVKPGDFSGIELGDYDKYINKFIDMHTLLDLETRRVLLRNLAESSNWLGRQGNREGALKLIETALRLNDDDRTLRGMAERLRGEQVD